VIIEVMGWFCLMFLTHNEKLSSMHTLLMSSIMDTFFKIIRIMNIWIHDLFFTWLLVIIFVDYIDLFNLFL
jgi:hypothetical protein